MVPSLSASSSGSPRSMHQVSSSLTKLMLLVRSGELNVHYGDTQVLTLRRYDSTSGGEREIQRTMLELLNQLDGFDSRGDVKVIMATNRIESLDPALIRPGRIDRKIEFPLPDIKTKRHIFKLHTARMSLAEDVDLEEFITMKDDLSGADIKAVCTESGLLALRERRMRVTKADFTEAREKVRYSYHGLCALCANCCHRSCIGRTRALPKACTCRCTLSYAILFLSRFYHSSALAYNDHQTWLEASEWVYRMSIVVSMAVKYEMEKTWSCAWNGVRMRMGEE